MLRLSITSRTLSACGYRSSSIALTNRAQSPRERVGGVTTWHRPARGSTSTKIWATPLRTHSWSTIPGRRSYAGMDLSCQLLARFVHASHRKRRIVGQVAYLQDVFHRGDEGGVAVGRDLPVNAQVRAQPVFLGSSQCLNRRIPDMESMQEQLRECQARRNKRVAPVNWQFTTEKARVKPRKI